MRYGVVLMIGLTCWVSGARAGTFQVGIADPGVGTISAKAVSDLGISMERRTVEWHGEDSFTGSLTWTPGLRLFLAVSGGWPVPQGLAPTTAAQRYHYCNFVASILEQYPQVHDVIVWNEINLSSFWGVGVSAYVQLLAACAPVIHAHGAAVWISVAPTDPNGAAYIAEALAGTNAYLADGWDQHSYGEISGRYLPETISTIRSILGWKIPVLVGESGGTSSEETTWQMKQAYCAGAMGWLNFKLRDDGDWRPTGLEYLDGTPKPLYYIFAAESRNINCASTPSPPPPPPLTTPPAIRVYPSEALAGFPQRIS